jgi:hypothetical protein
MKLRLLFISTFLFPLFLIAQDSIPPTPVLMDYGEVQMQEDSMSFPASFFNIGSYDNQTDSSDLRFAYSEDVSDSIKSFYCDNYNWKVFDLYVFDASGNFAMAEIQIKFQSQGCPDTLDTYPPTPYCFNGLATFADTHGVDLSASYFNKGAFDDRTPDSLIKVSFSQDRSDTIIHVSCDDIGETQEVQVYFTDLTGKSDYCRTYLTVTDGDNCQSNTKVVDNVDTIPPRLFVFIGIATVNVPTFTNLVAVYAKDFVNIAFDNITDEENIEFSFSTDKGDTINYYTCAHEGAHEIYIYAFDDVGNWSRVKTHLTIQTFPGGECDYPDVDTIPPTIICAEDTLTFSLSEDSIAQVNINQVIDTIYDDYTLLEDMFLNYGGSFSDVIEELGCDELGYHTYNFKATDLLLNSSTCVATIEIIDTMGICQTTASDHHLKSEQLKIYPNPASDRINIISSIQGNVLIVDALGRVIYRQKVKPDELIQLNCDPWNNGVYSAILQKPDLGVISTLFIVQ